MYSRTMSCLASRRADGSSVLLTPDFASWSISAHFSVLERSGMADHLLRRASTRGLSGRRERRRSDWEGVRKGSWAWRMSVGKCALRISRLRLSEDGSED